MWLSKEDLRFRKGISSDCLKVDAVTHTYCKVNKIMPCQK